MRTNKKDRVARPETLPRKWKPFVITVFWMVALLLATALILHRNPLEDPDTMRLKSISGCLMLALVTIVFTVFYDLLTTLPVELFQNRRLIIRLSKNDFRKRYAGSYLGVVWALVPPIITVLMYWFVFDKIFGSSRQFVREGVEVPYVLFLTSGLVPWFFFSDAISGGTR